MKVLLRINQFLHQNLVAISINWKDLIYDIEDEIWEFLPAILVLTKRKELEGKLVLVAVEEI